MSDIQRWDAHDRMSRNDARGYWVKYADHTVIGPIHPDDAAVAV